MPVDPVLVNLRHVHDGLKAEYAATHLKWLTEPDDYAKAVYQDALQELLARSCMIFLKLLALEGGIGDGA